jgi:glutaredoxin
MIELIDTIKQYQLKNGSEFDPQIILFKLSNCAVCKSLENELMVDGWSYETFDCLNSKHSDIADMLEETLQTNTYPIICITYPEPKILTIQDFDTNKSVYKQLTSYL